MKDYPFVQPGYVLEGKYCVERIIGAGGMGVVVAARHLAVDEPVAIKFMLPEQKKDESPARFLREAKMAIKLKSEHVARVMDVGELATGELYIVMEYLEGHDLSAYAIRGLSATVEAVEYVLQACEALAEAHALGIVHRDIKPANLFLIRRANGSPCIKVLDFGISKLGSATDATITLDTTALGTPLYMSPEQIRSAHEVDARADIWSLGVVLYQLLTGSPPFETTTVPKLFYQVIEKPHRPLREVASHVPVKLEEVINKCLEKDPNKRFQSVAALADALSEFAHRSRRFDRSAIATIEPLLPSVVTSTNTTGTFPIFKVEYAIKTLARTKAAIKPNHKTLILSALGLAGAFLVGVSVKAQNHVPLASRIRVHVPMVLPSQRQEESSSVRVVDLPTVESAPALGKTAPVKPITRPVMVTAPSAPPQASVKPSKDDREVTRK
jgi:serine/threonine-protein kinase